MSCRANIIPIEQFLTSFFYQDSADFSAMEKHNHNINIQKVSINVGFARLISKLQKPNLDIMEDKLLKTSKVHPTAYVNPDIGKES